VDIEQARFNMIQQQIRPWDVLDPNILKVLAEVPRERFVPEEYRTLAFADLQLPIGHGEVMMEPRVEARLVQELKLTGSEKVLEVGTGSGYVTALLAKLAASVVSVELYRDFSNRAAERLAATGLSNVMLEVGDASKGWPSSGGFDAIVLTGSVPELPEAFTDSLRPGGRLVAIVGTAPVMEAIRIEKSGERLIRTSLFDTLLPALVNAVVHREFVF
jgi:protein-L-isoaspartate(D-aspartate) O-methyltransferase